MLKALLLFFLCCVAGSEREYRFSSERLVGSEDAGREIVFIWSVGIELRFKAESVALFKRLVQKIARIELESRHGSRHGERYAVHRHINRRRFAESFAVYHEIVVESAGFVKLAYISLPIVFGVMKSNGVPFTGAISPVGIIFSPSGV